jgi:hypothetical protein
MTQSFRDPLLSSARGIIFIVQAVLLFAAVVLTVATPLIMVLRDRIAAELKAEYGDAALVLPIGAMTALLLLALLMIVLSWLFLRHLRRINDTVGEGDPFVPVNAERLTAMAWLMLAVQVLAIPLSSLAVYIGTVTRDPGASTDSDFDLSGMVLVVTFFILARVFRQGTAMRDDLEGTV